MKLFERKSFAGALLAFIMLAISSCDKVPGSSFDPVLIIKKTEVSADAGDMFVSVKVDGKWQLGVSFGEQEPWAELSSVSGEGVQNNVILAYQANSSAASRQMEVHLYASGKDISQLITQQAKPEDRPTDPDQPTDPDKPVDPDKPSESGKYVIGSSWLELPDMSNKELDYLTHFYEDGGKKYRNYSIGFSEKDVVAIWVAYPLCKSYLGPVRRTDAWAYDPILGSKISPAPFGDYGDDKTAHIYRDRGHLLPSGSRTCCRAANEQTFYGSNMAPQIGKQFNQSIWATLEGKVRSKASAVDTMYVVTGCLLKGSTRKLPDSDGKMITEPVGFYKVLLSYHENSTLNKWMGAAFYLDHKSYSTQAITKEMSMSIDDLEKLTGIDFFPNLVAKIGQEAADKVEMQNPKNIAFWW